MPVSSAPQQVVPEEPPTLAPASRGWTVAVVVALAVAATCAIALLREGNTAGELPQSTRAELLARTVRDLQDFCGPSRPEFLDDHCHELASFAARFPECRGECADRARQELTPRPTR